jgi:aspartyl-tRNA(Asn)/glutamyl-tRNA(Gln) amidotransferase subunit B
MAYKTTIGLEIHVELKTKSKMFCSCSNNALEKTPNTNICPVCMGHPGTLPVINEEAVNKVAKTGLALRGKISENSKFDRKNYFYPDLPKGYQISQYDLPISQGGFLKIGDKEIRITRVHLEEDTGRLVHPVGEKYSLVDFNRAGIPLMELVTEPDISSAEEARKFAQELQLILRYLNVSDADMEKGQMRVEANISVSETKALGTKVEIKNLNSFRAVEKGIEYEVKRQEEVLTKGKKVVQETMGWDDAKGQTYSQRLKEEAHDYRYFPEPDLPPLHFTALEIKELAASLPELPQARRERLKKEYRLLDQEAEMFIGNKSLAEYFEKVVSEFDPRLSQDQLFGLIKLAVNYLTSDLQGLLRGNSINQSFKITPENFAEFIALILQGQISSKIAKVVLVEMFETGADPSNIIEAKGLVQIVDEKELEKIIAEIISKNKPAVDDYKKGKETAVQFLIGQIMAQTKGKANPKTAQDVLLQLLTKEKE